MGVRSRKKSRNKSRYRIASKRRKASAKRKINPNIECSAVKAAWDSRKPASTNVSNMGLVYNLSKIGLSRSKSTREALFGGRNKTEGKPTMTVQQLEQEVCSQIQVKKPGIRLTIAQVEYAASMLDKYGNDYKAMAQDSTNYFQDTWRQIEKKIKLFMNNPKYYVPYLKKRGLLTPELLRS